jgi:hypothetical protein
MAPALTVPLKPAVLPALVLVKVSGLVASAVAETSVSPVGRTSVRVALVAGVVPVLVKVSVKVAGRRGPRWSAHS